MSRTSTDSSIINTFVQACDPDAAVVVDYLSVTYDSINDLLPLPTSTGATLFVKIRMG